MAISLTSVKISQIPEIAPLQEKGLRIPLNSIGLGDPWLEPEISLSYELSRIYGKFYGKFEASGAYRLACSRCLEDFEAEARAKFSLNFEEKPEVADPRKGLDPEDPELDVVFFEGDIIEFGDEVRQELELLLPFAPLCRSDCKGLCPVCGK